MWFHPGLDGARRPEVVQRQTQQNRVGVLDLVDKHDAQRERLVLRRRVLVDGQQSGRPCHAVEVRYRVHGEVAVVDRAAGMRRAPAVGRTGGKTPADGAVALHGRVDVKQVGHL